MEASRAQIAGEIGDWMASIKRKAIAATSTATMTPKAMPKRSSEAGDGQKGDLASIGK
jgi:hypothetical protein